MRNDLTAVEIVGLGIRSEEDAAKFYGMISKKITNDLVKAKFESLAKEEIDHKNILLALYKKMTGEAVPQKIPGSPETAEKGGIPVDISGVEELLKLAMMREHDACQFYKDAAAHAMDRNIKLTLEYLSNIERGHELMLQGELEAYLKDKDWYANNPDIQLVGP